MSCPRKLVRAALLALAATLAGAAALWACGPFFPYWFVTDEGRMMEAPTTWFRAALAELVHPLDRRPVAKAVVAERGPYRQTADVDQTDIAAVTSNRGLLAEYSEVREVLASYGEAVASWQQEAAWATQPPPRPEPPPDLRVPAGLPAEFEDYLRGAIAYHQGNLIQARASWERLLDRPVPQRRYRSTWAAFMLGKAYLQEDPEVAIRWFERTREMVSKEFFPDPLGLAAASFGWQARAELNLDRPQRALPLYFQQMKTGDPSAVPSMRRVAGKALDDPKALKKIAVSDDARPIMTAYVISRWDRPEHDGPLDPAPARKWLEALKATNPPNVNDAERLAWVAYRAGDFAAAEEWLKRASGERAMSHWIRARLFLRAGKLPEAEAALRLAGRHAPTDVGMEAELFQAYENQVQPPVRPHAEGETGATQLARGEYIDAIYNLLDGGYWTDGAYIVERVLTTEELTAYMEKSWPVKLASHRPEDYGDRWTMLYAGMVSPSQERLAYDLRYLVGRRLVREGRYQEAEKFLPTSLGKLLRMLARSMAEGRDGQRPAEERARSLFHAACVTRYQGLELSGTELEPDWFIYEAQFENEPFAIARAKGQFSRLGPTKDEIARARKTRVTPFKRFHYRYRGMELAKEAADLLPDGTEKARILATAGNWVEGRDPKAAQPFLEALLSCCGETEIGQRAKRANAVPNVPDACEAETRVGGSR
ncbi:MAG TPA: CDC27 family protein [Thermoanaerobaculia bacterium]